MSSSEARRAQGPSIDTAGMRLCRLALAVLVLAFAALYPYLDATGFCGEPGCPELSYAHASASTELPPGALVAVLAAVPAAALAGRVWRRFVSDRKPLEVYLSPEPDPPRRQAGL